MNSHEQEKYISSIKSHTDRELQEIITYNTRKQTEYLKKIYGIAYVFWLFVVLTVVASAIFLYAQHEKFKRMRYEVESVELETE